MKIQVKYSSRKYVERLKRRNFFYKAYDNNPDGKGLTVYNIKLFQPKVAIENITKNNEEAHKVNNRISRN